MNIAVIGAGIVGATASLAIKEAFPNSRLTIFSDAFTPHTTGDGSAGLWGPYILQDTPAEDILRWSGESHRWFLNIWKSKFNAETGVSLISTTRVTSAPEGFPEPDWISSVYGARKLLLNDLQRLNKEHNAEYTGGWQFVTFTGEPQLLIPWVLNKFKLLGGRIENRKIRDLEELVTEGFDLLINCSGLGARDLIKDLSLKPIRGQVSRVEASWIFNVFLVDDDDGNYIIPNTESVVLGGTHQENDYDCEIREQDTKFIIEGCSRIIPALRESKIIKQWAGLRPGRPRVRLEKQSLKTKTGREFTVIHNYGHGGSGVTLSWGCALDVVKIIRELSIVKKHSKL